MPMAMANPATRAEEDDTSPTDEQAKTPTRTATRVEMRNKKEFSGAWGAFARRTISKNPPGSCPPASTRLAVCALVLDGAEAPLVRVVAPAPVCALAPGGT